jgi:SAM-dependent methyltransferase
MMKSGLLKASVGRMRWKLLGLRNRIYERFRPKLRDAQAYIGHVKGKEGLEIGGPSWIFRSERLIPLYKHVGRLDGVNFSAKTVWSELHEGQNYNYLADRDKGFQFIMEGTDLCRIPSATYDFVLSSHSLEHTANPIMALKEWMRVLKTEGVLLLVLPHKERTFDHRRPTTELRHMIADYENGTAENDLTHLPEVLEYHDLSLDPGGGDLEFFRKRSLENFANRCLHHHVFDLRTALALVDHVGLQILRAETMLPCHIVVLARKATLPENRRFLAVDSDVFMKSRFRTDRQ